MGSIRALASRLYVIAPAAALPEASATHPRLIEAARAAAPDVPGTGVVFDRERLAPHRAT